MSKAPQHTNLLLHEKFNFTIYALRFLDPRRVIIGGGGGHEIPNTLLISELDTSGAQAKLKEVARLDTQKEVVWTMSVRNNIECIAFCSADKLNILKYKKQAESANDSAATSTFSFGNFEDKITQPLFSLESDKEKKFVAFASDDTIVTNDDHFHVLVYTLDVKKWKLQLKFEMKEHKKALTDLNAKDSIAVSTAEDKSLIIWNLQDGTVKHKIELPANERHEFKACKITNAGTHVVALITGFGGPSYIAKYNIATGKREYYQKINKNPTTVMCLSQHDTFDAKTEDEYLGFGISGEVNVKDTRRALRQYMSHHKAHRDDPISAMDILYTPGSVETLGEGTLSVASGSLFNRTVNIYQVSARYKSNLNLLFFTLVIALLAVLYRIYFKK